MRLLVTALIGFALTVGAVSAVAATDSYSDKGGVLDTSVPHPEQVARAERMTSFVDPLLESGLLDEAENFGGTAYDIDGYAYDMWWRGDVPANVQAVLDSFGDINVRIHDAKYTKQEIESAATKVAQYRSSMFNVMSTTLESLERPTPVHGIEVEVKRHGHMSLEAISEELTNVAGIPVTVNQDLASVPAIGGAM